jgi:hypothetical protein
LNQLFTGIFSPRFALDLVEVYFQIVHTRLPLLNPQQFRNKLHLQPGDPPNTENPLHPALVATVLAWGTKFSEHPLLVADRKRPKGQSLLAKTLIDRARNLAEALKVHRVPSPDHVVIGLLLEPLQSRESKLFRRCFIFSILLLQKIQTIQTVSISAENARPTLTVS